MNSSTLVLAVALSTTGSGCAYYTAHELVPTNIRTTEAEALTAGPTRVEAQVCGNRLFSIPFGPDPTMDALIRALEDQTANTVALEDICIDHVFINYLFIFWQDCVHGTATPLLAAAKPRMPKHQAREAPPPAPPSEQPTTTETPPAASSPPPEPFADPFAH